MKHYIICKFFDKSILDTELQQIENIFNECLNIEGINSVEVKRNVIDRPNRFDLMIKIDMKKEALEVYDSCNAHHKWKELYSDKLLSKTIFDED